MKKIFFILLFLIHCVVTYSQDSIYTIKGDEIKAKVTEIGAEIIKYKLYNHLNGPERTIRKNEVYMIIYENGVREVFKQENEPGKTSTPVSKNQNVKIEEPESNFFKYRQHKYFMIGIGIGNSYGGAGIKVQGRFGKEVGFGIHAGLGYFPDAPIMFSGGVKVFPYKWVYFDTMIGVLGVKTTRGPMGAVGEVLIEKELLWGPSLLIGGDFIIGRHFGINVASGFSIETKDAGGYFALDLGFITKF